MKNPQLFDNKHTMKQLLAAVKQNTSIKTINQIKVLVNTLQK